MSEWVEVSFLASLEGTISKFPFLKDGINAKKIADLVRNKKCGANLQSFVVLNNTVIRSSGKSDEKSKWLLDLLNERAKTGILPDMYFLYSDGSDISKENLDPICRELPIFTTAKNITSPLEQTRFFLPDLSGKQNWSVVVEATKKQNEASRWENRSKKAYFPASNEKLGQELADPNIDLSVYSQAHGAGFVLLSQERPDLIEARFDKKLLEPVFARLGWEYEKKNLASNSADQTPNFRYQVVIDQHNDDKLQELLFSSSVVLMPLPQRARWVHSKISPGIHFVPLAPDLSDVFSRIFRMNDNEELAQKVYQKANLEAEASLEYGTMSEQLFETLRKYATLQQLELSAKVKEQIVGGANIEEALLK